MTTMTPPPQLGRYAIRSEIGRGMMGIVYEAFDPALGRTVALKTIQVAFAISGNERQLFEQRFMSEARLAAGLSHPNIVVVHDVGWDEGSGTPYMALEFLKGQPLADLVPPPLDWREALRIGARLADALYHAHLQGIVHRDVKPANVMLLPSGEPKIMDFGIARAPASQLTAAGEFFGTPSYMSPEQAAGNELDGRSDLFSLGAVLYILLTGRRAFDAKSVTAILTKVEREDPERPSAIVPGIPAEVDGIIAKTLAKKVEDRYQDGRQLAQDIEDVLRGRPPQHLSSAPTNLLVAPVKPDASEDPTTFVKKPSVSGQLVRLAERMDVRVALGVVALAALIGGLLRLDWRGAPSSRTAGAASPSLSALPTPQVAATAVGSPSAAPRAAAGAPGAMPSQAATTTPATAAASATASGSPKPRDPAVAASTAPAGGGGRAAAEPARITIAVEHSLKQGTLRVRLDKRLVLEKELTSQETKKALVFRGRKGSLFEVIEAPPGDHAIRVEVSEGKGRPERAGQIQGSFQSGQTRLLEVKVGGQVSLKWR
jgi:serine/threonine-protein kinase